MAARLRRESGASDGDSCRMSSASRAKSLAGVLRAKPFSPIFFRVISSSSTIPESPEIAKIHHHKGAARVDGKAKTWCDHICLSAVSFFACFYVPLTDGRLGYNSSATTKRGIFPSLTRAKVPAPSYKSQVPRCETRTFTRFNPVTIYETRTLCVYSRQQRARKRQHIVHTQCGQR